MVFARQSKGVRSTRRYQSLKPLIAREIPQNPSIVRVIFNNQQNGIIRLKLVTIVWNPFDRMFRNASRRQLNRQNRRRRSSLPRSGTGRSHISLGQVQSEGASLTRRASQLYFAA